MKFGYLYCLLINSATICLGVNLIEGNSNVKKVYDDTMSRLTCPVTNVSDVLTARLSQFTEVNLKNEDVTTIFWLEQVTFTKDAPLKYPGEVTSDWNPPAVCKTSCLINVEYFLLDEQTCFMKFGSWSYDGAQVNFKYKDKFPEKSLVLVDIDVNGCYMSVGLELPVDTIGWYPQKNKEWLLQKYTDMDIKLIVRRRITIGDIINMLLPCLFTFQCFYRLVNEHVQMRAVYSEVSD